MSPRSAKNRSLPIGEVGARVTEWLGTYRGLPFCADCLAHEVGISRTDATRAITALTSADGFRGTHRWCARCMRELPVICADVAPKRRRRAWLSRGRAA